MSTFKREQREHAENISFEKAELYKIHLEKIEEQEEIDECEGTLIAWMGIEEFKKLPKDNLRMIVNAMQEYARTFIKGKL